MSKKALDENFLKALSASKTKKGTYGVKSSSYGFSYSQRAAELAESWHNGNRKFVIEELDKMTKKRGLATLYYIVDYLGDGNSNYDQSVLGRMLGDRL